MHNINIDDNGNITVSGSFNNNVELEEFVDKMRSVASIGLLPGKWIHYIDRYKAAGNQVAAIQVYRQVSKASLLDAKNIIDGYFANTLVLTGKEFADFGNY